MGSKEKILSVRRKQDDFRLHHCFTGRGMLTRCMSVYAFHSFEGVVSGADAFELYDTFGFPLELTEEAALEAGLTVDSEGFEKNMEAQRQRARSARGELDLTASTIYSELAQRTGGTEFLGYAGTSAPNCRVSGRCQGRVNVSATCSHYLYHICFSRCRLSFR